MWIDELSKTFFPPSSSMCYHQLPCNSDSVIFIGISVLKYAYKTKKKKRGKSSLRFLLNNIYICALEMIVNLFLINVLYIKILTGWEAYVFNL